MIAQKQKNHDLYMEKQQQFQYQCINDQWDVPGNVMVRGRSVARQQRISPPSLFLIIYEQQKRLFSLSDGALTVSNSTGRVVATHPRHF